MFLLVAMAAICSGLCHAQWVWTPETGWINNRYDPRADAQALYREAEKLLEKKNYRDAMTTLEKIVEQYPNLPEGKESLYVLGECCYILGDYYDAYLYYGKYHLIYPATPRIREILKKEYEIGRILIDGKKYLFAMDIENRQSLERGETSRDLRRMFAGHDCALSQDAVVQTEIENQKWIIEDGEQKYAVVHEKEELKVYREGQSYKVLGIFSGNAGAYGVEILKKLLKISPHAEFADEAQMAIADHYFLEGEYLDAQENYLSLLDQYPKSVWCPLALYQMAMCSALQYSGPSYEREPLLKAEERLKEYRRKYQKTAAIRLNQKVDMLMAQVRDKQAKKEFMIAEYYLGQGEIAAAKIYLYTIVRGFPDTPTAKQAQKLLQRLKNES